VPVGATVTPMIRIWVESAHPPCGRVVFEGQSGRIFAGWLDLLSILADAIASGPVDGPPDGAGSADADADSTPFKAPGGPRPEPLPGGR
jgi:hypothetical protein